MAAPARRVRDRPTDTSTGVDMPKTIDQSYHTAINWMERETIVQHLEGVGIACHDNESTDELREALRENVMDGTIPLSSIDTSDEADRRAARRMSGG